MVICDYSGIVWQKSNIGIWENFQFQNHHPRNKITVSSLLNRLQRLPCSQTLQKYACKGGREAFTLLLPLSHRSSRFTRHQLHALRARLR